MYSPSIIIALTSFFSDETKTLYSTRYYVLLWVRGTSMQKSRRCTQWYWCLLHTLDMYSSLKSRHWISHWWWWWLWWCCWKLVHSPKNEIFCIHTWCMGVPLKLYLFPCSHAAPMCPIFHASSPQKGSSKWWEQWEAQEEEEEGPSGITDERWGAWNESWTWKNGRKKREMENKNHYCTVEWDVNRR